MRLSKLVYYNISIKLYIGKKWSEQGGLLVKPTDYGDYHECHDCDDTIDSKTGDSGEGQEIRKEQRGRDETYSR